MSRTAANLMNEINAYVYQGIGSYRGWHEDYLPGEPNYLPMMQQSKLEFEAMLGAIAKAGLVGGRCLQLGLGVSGASHRVWQIIFSRVLTIDLGMSLADDMQIGGMNTHSGQAVGFAMRCEPYDFLFIDAGHSLSDAQLDYISYSGMVRKGGIIAFHDALERNGYPEVEVHKFLKSLPPWKITTVGTEVGTAWMVKE